MDYDVLVLGGGIIGCAVAYELSKYNLNIAVIEKEYDIADDVSFVNTSIVYDGSETSNNVMAGLEYIGNILLEDLCEKFDVPFKRIGALRVVNDNNGVVKLGEMYDRAIRRGIDGVYLIEPDEVYEIERIYVGDLYLKGTPKTKTNFKLDSLYTYVLVLLFNLTNNFS